MTTENTKPKDETATPVAAAAAPATEEKKDLAEDFDSVFDEITKDDESKPAVPNDGQKAPVVAKTAEEIAAEEAAKAVVKTPEEIAAEEAAAAATAAAAKPDDELTKAQARIAELEAAAATPKDTKTPEAKAEEKPATETKEDGPVWYKPTDEENEVLKAHNEQWPDIAKAEEVRTKIAFNNALAYAFHQVKKTYDPVIERFVALSDAMEAQLTLGILEKKHPDYDTIRPQVEAWIETLPGAFKTGAQQVIKEGTPEDVSDLISEFKKANPNAVAAPAAAAASASKPELSTAAKKAAAKLTVVDSKRTTVATAPDPNDFDAAWLEASAASK